MELDKAIFNKETINTNVICARCGRVELLHNTWADPHGRPYVDYYCCDCANIVRAKPGPG
jgi:hypothetical protein